MEATDKDLMTIFVSEMRRDHCQDITDYAGTAKRAMRRAYNLGVEADRAERRRIAEWEAEDRRQRGPGPMMHSISD